MNNNHQTVFCRFGGPPAASEGRKQAGSFMPDPRCRNVMSSMLENRLDTKFLRNADLAFLCQIRVVGNSCILCVVEIHVQADRQPL